MIKFWIKSFLNGLMYALVIDITSAIITTNIVLLTTGKLSTDAAGLAYSFGVHVKTTYILWIALSIFMLSRYLDQLQEKKAPIALQTSILWGPISVGYVLMQVFNSDIFYVFGAVISSTLLFYQIAVFDAKKNKKNNKEDPK